MGIRDYPGIYYPGLKYNPRDKARNIRNHVDYMLNRTQSMFRYENLPDTIPQRSLELLIQTRGYAGIAEKDNNLYAFDGGLGGEPDVNYMPTLFVVSNPALKFSRNYRINEDCVIIPNDSLYRGSLPLCSKYASSIVETELTLYIALVNTRAVDLITAGTDRAKTAADKVLTDIEDGKLASIIDKGMEGSIKAFPYSQATNNSLTQIVEVLQYLKAQWFNELGLNANYNMKRETLTSGETGLNDDALSPLIDDMLRCRAQAVEKINKMFGTNIKVSLASAWKDNAEEIELEHQKMAEEADLNLPANQLRSVADFPVDRKIEGEENET